MFPWSGSNKGIGIIIGLVVFAAFHFLHPAARLSSGGTDPYWDEKVAGRDTTKPTLVIFTAQWCGSCQAMESVVLSRRDVRDELYDHYNVYSVDLTAPSPLVQQRASRFGVSSIPTLIRFNEDGKETARRHGGTPEDVMGWLRDGE